MDCRATRIVLRPERECAILTLLDYDFLDLTKEAALLDANLTHKKNLLDCYHQEVLLVMGWLFAIPLDCIAHLFFAYSLFIGRNH